MYEILTDEQKAKIAKRIEEKIMKAVDKINFADLIMDSISNTVDFADVLYDHLDTQELGINLNDKVQEAFKKVMK